MRVISHSPSLEGEGEIHSSSLVYADSHGDDVAGGDDTLSKKEDGSEMRSEISMDISLSDPTLIPSSPPSNSLLSSSPTPISTPDNSSYSLHSSDNDINNSINNNIDNNNADDKTTPVNNNNQKRGNFIRISRNRSDALFSAFENASNDNNNNNNNNNNSDNDNNNNVDNTTTIDNNNNNKERMDDSKDASQRLISEANPHLVLSNPSLPSSLPSSLSPPKQFSPSSSHDQLPSSSPSSSSLSPSSSPSLLEKGKKESGNKEKGWNDGKKEIGGIKENGGKMGESGGGERGERME